MGALLIAAAVILGFGYLSGDRATTVRPGQDAPDVELAAVEGAGGRLKGNLGAATVVVFIDTRWPQMARYADVLERFYRKYQRRRLRVIGICLDASRQAAMEFIQAHAITFTVFHDPGGRATQEAWGTPRGPESYLLDSSGRVLDSFPEPVDWMREDRRSRVEPLLPSPQPGAW